ncbi:MAG: cytochrome c oxidase subunit 3 [Saprospiraceae bacterium]|nr:cytochrome c oxidase subunit 3 [Saprospiraceae bacterium]
MTSQQRRSFGIHPYKILVYLLLAGITALFLALSAAYLYTRINHGMPALAIPPVFIVNIGVLLSSSFFLIRAKRDYQRDDTERYKRDLLITIILTILFVCGQIYGWSSMIKQDIAVNEHTGASYLYLISGVHLAHVFGGLPFLILFYITAVRKMVEPVSVLLYFTDPEKRMKLNLLTIYWHFLDALWIYLVIFFAANYLLSGGSGV